MLYFVVRMFSEIDKLLFRDKEINLLENYLNKNYIGKLRRILMFLFSEGLESMCVKFIYKFF